MVIGDRVYDVSSFAERHPGGGIINFVVGTDATEHFRQMHYRSKR